MFEWIKFVDLNNGPIISNILPPIADEILNPKILNKEKKITININWKKYLIFFITIKYNWD